MIVSFGDAASGDLYHGRRTRRVRGFPAEIQRAAPRKLDMLEGARLLSDLRAPPANRLEVLRGDLAGFCSIRVDEQWRILFRWEQDGAHDVALVDYH